jgi:single-stranded DNA-specific DHH superfamily exonuclease
MLLNKPVNRAFVNLARVNNPGIKALATRGGEVPVPLDALSSSSLGFKIGPPINASSRIGQCFISIFLFPSLAGAYHSYSFPAIIGMKPDLAARLLCGDDVTEVNLMAQQLLLLNGHRQRLEHEQYQIVLKLAGAQVY